MKSPLIYVPSKGHAEGEIIAGGHVQGLVAWKLTRGGKVVREGSFTPNLIVNGGMNALSFEIFDNMTALMNVGTGSTAPANAQTTLVAEVGTARVGRTSSVIYTYVAGPPDYWYRRHVYKFLEASANGNLTEVGLWSAAGTMFMRQLLKDGAGTPTVITKTNLDQLEITYEYRWYPAPADVVSSLTLDAVVYALTTRAHNVTNVFQGQILSQGPRSNVGAFALETDVLLARNGAQAVGTGSTDNTQTAYVVDSYQLEHKCVWDVGVANFATGIGLFTHYALDSTGGTGSHLYQTKFVPKIPKTNVKKLTIFLRRSWARYP